MGRWISNFNTTAEFETFQQTDGYGEPHVSLTKDNMQVHFIPYVPQETRLVAKYNVTSTTEPTKISFYGKVGRVTYNGLSGFSSIEIDGVEQPSPLTTGQTAYTFNTLGEHTVKYTLKDPTTIGVYAFCNCRSLTSIDIPDSVTSIGNSAFRDCSDLTSCTIGSGVTSIGISAFNGCSSLTSIDIPSGVTSIGNSAFASCSGLTSIEIPNSVTSIGSGAFENCYSLTSIDIPNSVTSIGGNGAFRNCSGLTSCTIGSGVTSIDDSAFASCTSLTSIDIPSGVTSIGGSAFRVCSSLTSCTIGSGVTYIGESAFYGCSGLTSIMCYATTAPTIQSSTFKDVKTNGILYVPIGSSGYDTWMQNADYYLGKYNWTKELSE